MVAMGQAGAGGTKVSMEILTNPQSRAFAALSYLLLALTALDLDSKLDRHPRDEQRERRRRDLQPPLDTVCV